MYVVHRNQIVEILGFCTSFRGDTVAVIALKDGTVTTTSVKDICLIKEHQDAIEKESQKAFPMVEIKLTPKVIAQELTAPPPQKSKKKSEDDDFGTVNV